MSSNIATRQNEDKCIRMLAAQRQIYSDVKQMHYFILFISIVLPLALNLLADYIKDICGIESSIVLAVLSILAILVVLLLERCNNKKIELAALIQQQFDLYVFDMPWNVDIYGKNRNVDEEITEHSMVIYDNVDKRKCLLNWYGDDFATEDNKESIYRCQKQNFSWDYDLRNYYQAFCISVIVVVVVGLLGWGIYINTCLRQWLLVVSYYTPLIVSFVRAIIRIEDDKIRLLSMKQILDDKGPLSKHRLYLAQGSLYDHRKKCYLIPDWYYSIHKNYQEKKQKILSSFR